ncbi:protein-ADP-ribose hydrolase [Nocardia pseudovaccinii]|uniref:protein-ADP-ribose hydrolase n=1 Tax=Nocardia pseudovaccinii TaxID=189540 RepID=UPI001C3F73C5|nr:protein-ADP-ribose hydrolase [Nocardia pseudovaccinii]
MATAAHSTSRDSGTAVRPIGEPTVCTELPLDGYRSAISLDEPFLFTSRRTLTTSSTDLIRSALTLLCTDPVATQARMRPSDIDRLDDNSARRLLRAVLTVRQPGPLPIGADEILDDLLAHESRTRNVVETASLPTIADAFPHFPHPAADRITLWKGDITALRADAIINAANNALLGCFQPMHQCVDNAIHSVAGPRLREDCHMIMNRQGHPEPTGTAKITRGYHLPARYVLHTVGPVVDGLPYAADRLALASAYRSCLDLAAEIADIHTIAFCGISTGVFGYPKTPAAHVALDTVAEWLGRYSRFDRVIFTVYSNDDYRVYRRALSERAGFR